MTQSDEGTPNAGRHIRRRYLHILDEVQQQLDRQLDKWGVQSHPDGTADNILNRAYSRGGQEQCEEARSRGQMTWMHVLTEEVLEAHAEDPGTDNLRIELIQVAAVAIAWVENLDRRGIRHGQD